MSYHVLFTGKLKPGMSKAQTIERLAQITGMDAARVEQRFFSGEPVKLKSMPHKGQAEAFVNKLLARDIVADVVAEPTSETVEQPATSRPHQPILPPEPEPEPQHAETPEDEPLEYTVEKRTSKLPAILASAAILVAVAVGGGAYFLYSLFDTSVPAFVNKAENTLLNNEEAVLLGHVNVEQLVNMENLVRDVKAPAPNPDSDALWDQLLLHDIDPRRQVEQIIFSLNFDDDIGPYLNALLLTDTDSSAIRGFLENNYQVQTTNQNNIEILSFRKQDVESCRYSQAQALVLGDGFVALSHPQKVAPLYQQLQSSDAGQVVNQQWVDYRSQRLLSVGLLQPEQMNSGAMGIAGMFLSGLQSEWQSMQAVFAGVQGNMLPPSVSFDLTVASDDPRWLAASRDKLQSGFEQLDPAGNEILALLKRKVAIESNQQELGTRFTIDGELVEASEKLIQEGLGSLMSISGGNGTGSSMAGMEQIDDNPQQYQTNVSLADIDAFENRYNEHFDWIEGPFAGRLNTVAINRDGLTTIEVVVQGQEMPNPPGAKAFGDPGGITAIDVKDAQGNSLLQEETCGSNLNHHVAPFQFGAKASKKVRLKPGADIDDVAGISGNVRMRIATQTETERLIVPLQATTLTNNGTELNIGSVEGGSVSYSIGGRPGGFLAMRALNKDGKYLASSGSFSMNDSHSQQFLGEIHALELVKAMNYQTVEQSFAFDSVQPTHSDGGFGEDYQPVQAYDTTDWDNVIALAENLNPEDSNTGWLGDPVATHQAGPATVSLFQPQVQQRFEGLTFSAELMLDLPYVAALESKANAIQLQINALQFANGQSAFPLHGTAIPTSFSSLTSGGYKDVNKSEQELREDIYLTGRATLNVPLKNDNLVGASLQQLQGELQFHLPTAARTQEVDSFALGDEITFDDFNLQVVSVGSGALTLAIEGDYQSLVDVLVVGNDNKVLADGIAFSPEQQRFGVKPNYQGEPEPPPRNLGELRFNGKPETLVVVIADETAVFQYPVTLGL